MDLGPEFGPEDYEARQLFNQGLQHYLDFARRPGPPVSPMGQVDPAYQAYYSKMRELQSDNPYAAAELSREAALVGRMADRRRGRRLRMKPPPPLSQSPYVALPLPPGYGYSEIATIGMPVRYGLPSSLGQTCAGTLWCGIAVAAGVAAGYLLRR